MVSKRTKNVSLVTVAVVIVAAAIWVWYTNTDDQSIAKHCPNRPNTSDVETIEQYPENQNYLETNIKGGFIGFTDGGLDYSNAIGPSLSTYFPALIEGKYTYFATGVDSTRGTPNTIHSYEVSHDPDYNDDPTYVAPQERWSVQMDSSDDRNSNTYATSKPVSIADDDGRKRILVAQGTIVENKHDAKQFDVGVKIVSVDDLTGESTSATLNLTTLAGDRKGMYDTVQVFDKHRDPDAPGYSAIAVESLGVIGETIVFSIQLTGGRDDLSGLGTMSVRWSDLKQEWSRKDVIGVSASKDNCGMIFGKTLSNGRAVAMDPLSGKVVWDSLKTIPDVDKLTIQSLDSWAMLGRYYSKGNSPRYKLLDHAGKSAGELDFSGIDDVRDLRCQTADSAVFVCGVLKEVRRGPMMEPFIVDLLGFETETGKRLWRATGDFPDMFIRTTSEYPATLPEPGIYLSNFQSESFIGEGLICFQVPENNPEAEFSQELECVDVHTGKSFTKFNDFQCPLMFGDQLLLASSHRCAEDHYNTLGIFTNP